MKYYKRIEDGFIVLIGTNCGGIEITKDEYDNIMNVISEKPPVREGYDWKLTETLEWVEYELPIIDENID